MNRVPCQPYPGSDFTPSLTFVPSLSVSRLYTSPNAVQFAWYRAIPDPTFDKEAGAIDSAAGRGEYLRELQPGTFWCILDDSSSILKRYMPQGTWESGTVAVSYDPAVTPLSVYDWIVPMAQDGLIPSVPAPGVPLLPAANVKARTYVAKETIVRGAVQRVGTGTVTTSGTNVTGVGTTFSTSFAVGDILAISQFAARIIAIADNAHLTLDVPPPHNFIGIGYCICSDVLTYSPVARVSLVRSQSTSFLPDTDFTVTSGFPAALLGDTIHWLSPTRSPAPGERYSVIYDYVARYELTGLGSKPPIVGGASLLASQVASLWKPQASGL